MNFPLQKKGFSSLIYLSGTCNKNACTVDKGLFSVLHPEVVHLPEDGSRLRVQKDVVVGSVLPHEHTVLEIHGLL